MPGIRFAQLLIGLSLGLTSIFVFPGLTLAQQKPKLRPLHIALANHSVSMTAIYVAKQLGIFENYGYDARVLVLEPRAGIGALLSGDLDCYTAIGSTARAALRGAPVRVGLVALNRSDFILVANKEITSIEQLRGKVIGGYTPQGTVNVVLAELLRRKGLRPEEYKVVNAGTARGGSIITRCTWRTTAATWKAAARASAPGFTTPASIPTSPPTSWKCRRAGSACPCPRCSCGGIFCARFRKQFWKPFESSQRSETKLYPFS